MNSKVLLLFISLIVINLGIIPFHFNMFDGIEYFFIDFLTGNNNRSSNTSNEYSLQMVL